MKLISIVIAFGLMWNKDCHCVMVVDGRIVWNEQVRRGMTFCLGSPYLQQRAQARGMYSGWNIFRAQIRLALSTRKGER